MNTRTTMLVLVTFTMAFAAHAGESAANDEADLRAAETAFAKTMEDRDLEAFASFLHPETVFSSSKGPLRGEKAVVDAWSAFFVGEKAPFSWAPEDVVVRASGGLGLSSGPVFDPAGTRIGTFNSVWIKDGEQWKIIFDRGCPPCRCPDGQSGD